jgi:hypothetical protein
MATVCTISVSVKDLDDVDASAFENAVIRIKNNRSFYHGTELIGPFEKTAAFDANGDASIDCIETETIGEKMEIQIEYDQASSTQIIPFKSAEIPNSASADLSTITSVKSYSPF